MLIKIEYLMAPGSGSNSFGKFYLGILDDRVPYTVHGPNSPSASGTPKRQNSANDVRKMIATKLKAEYERVAPDKINAAAQNHLVDLIMKAYPELKGKGFKCTVNGIEFMAPVSGPATPVQRPRSSKSKLVHGWF